MSRRSPIDPAALLVSTKDACRMLAVSEAKLWELAALGHIKAHPVIDGKFIRASIESFAIASDTQHAEETESKQSNLRPDAAPMEEAIAYGFRRA
jgi:hypothetical protein